MKKLAIFALCLSAAGCSTTLLNPPAAKKKMLQVETGSVTSLVQFSDTRTETHFGLTRPTSATGYVTGDFVSCFSPMPDTATQIAATLKAGGSFGASQNLSQNLSSERSRTTEQRSTNASSSLANTAGNELNASGNLDTSLTTTVIELDGRTELVVATRDIFNSLCMFYVNGTLTPTQVNDKFDATLEVIKTLANADADEAKAKKSEAAAKAATAAAIEKQAQAALIAKQAETVRNTRKSVAEKIYAQFVSSAGIFDNAAWRQFLQSPELAGILDGYQLSVLKGTNINKAAILAELSDPLYEDELVEILELVTG